MPFVNSFMRQHRLTHNIADRKNVWNISAHLAIDFNEATISNDHTSLIRCNFLAIRCATNRLQYEIVTLGFLRRALTFEGDVDTVFLGNCCNGFGFQHQIVKSWGIHLLPDFDQITVSALHQTILHFNDVKTCTECRVHSPHFQTNNATTHDQHFLWNAA